MRPGYHIALSAAVSGVLQYLTGDMRISVMNFVTGILIDLDHIPDYIYYSGRVFFSPARMLDDCNHLRLNRLFLLFHSVELVLPAVILAFLSGNPYLAGGAVGCIQHLLADGLFNNVNLGIYSMTVKIIKRFDAKAFYRTK